MSQIPFKKGLLWGSAGFFFPLKKYDSKQLRRSCRLSNTTMCRSLSGKKRRREMRVIFGIPKNLATVILVDGRNLEPPGISVKTYKIVKKKSYQASVVNARFLNHQYLLDGAFKRSPPQNYLMQFRCLFEPPKSSKPAG